MPEPILDPYLPWRGEFPYAYLDRRLREVGAGGLSTAASAEEVRDALYDLMAGDVSEQDHQVWDELCLLDRRLMFDFFFYWLDGPALEAARKLCHEEDEAGHA